MGCPSPRTAALLLLCCTAMAAAALDEPAALQGTAQLGEFGPTAGCGLPSVPSWAGLAALSPNSSLALQVKLLLGDR